ncbi:MAG: glycosyltransferase family 2 protein [Muribaculaceae bacterium]|nr:glycosyltransferase family 2 protein [Muribaculaceae bacterium]
MISIIIPVYNIAAYLKKCLNSIRNQTITNFEVILVNDGSTDGSDIICEEYKNYDFRFKVIHQPNLGVSEARNTGIKNISLSSKYVTFIDGDDYIHPYYLEYLYKAIKEDNYELALCLFERRILNDADSTFSPIFYKTVEISRDYLFSGIFTKLKKDQFIEGLPDSVVWGRLYRKDIVTSNLFKSILSEDIEFNSRILINIKRVILVNEKLYFSVPRKGSLSNNPKSSVYYDYSFWTDTFYLSLENIPKYLIKYRAYALIGLFKAILSSKFDFSGSQSVRVSKFNMIYKQYLKEWINNQFIPSKIKWGILLMYKIPIIYKIYRNLKAI